VTSISVLEAINAMKIESNRVYVMPSNVDISITDGHFGLTPRVADHKQHLPIDIFMSSLAEARKSQAIGVILQAPRWAALRELKPFAPKVAPSCKIQRQPSL
jgi:chemotaxis response regulator CheB